jgi:hypothetical protein
MATSVPNLAMLVMGLRLGSLVLGAAIVAFALAMPSAAIASGLSAAERAQLLHGQTVVRVQTIENDEHRYVGGVTYTIVDSSPAELASILDDVDAYRRVLPQTKSARLVGRDHGDTLIELRQGNSLVTATYTVRVRRESDGRVARTPERSEGSGASGFVVRFWMDPSHPHAIDDAWGFFRTQPVEVACTPYRSEGAGAGCEPRTLLTYGVLLDMGAGLARELFEERVRDLMLTVPQLVRGYVAELHAGSPRAQL